MRTVLISGANRGLGLATAKLLGRQGFRVWLGSRSDVAGATATSELRREGSNVTAVQLDVTDENSVVAAARHITAETGLDILINNAAIMDEGYAPVGPASPAGHASIEAMRRTYEVNVLGAVRLTQAMLPCLLRSEHAAIVYVSSRLGSFAHQTDPNWPGRAVNKLAYASSKAALNMIAVMFSYQLRHTGIRVNAVSPGIIATDLNGEGAANLHGRSGFAPPEEGAKLVVECALIPKDGPNGQFFGPGGTLGW